MIHITFSFLDEKNNTKDNQTTKCAWFECPGKHIQYIARASLKQKFKTLQKPLHTNLGIGS